MDETVQVSRWDHVVTSRNKSRQELVLFLWQSQGDYHEDPARYVDLGCVVTLRSLTGAAAQQDQPFCLQEVDGKLTCHFETMAQCQDALKSGPIKTGKCIPNPKTKR